MEMLADQIVLCYRIGRLCKLAGKSQKLYAQKRCGGRTSVAGPLPLEEQTWMACSSRRCAAYSRV